VPNLTGPGFHAVELHESLDRLGIHAGDAVIVHASFRPFGLMGWDPAGMVDALVKHLGNRGTLAFPTMSWRTVTPESPRFSEISTPGHVGVLSEVFRTHVSTARSLHPTHSVAACGPEAGHLVEGHHVDTTPCSSRSPFARLADMGGKALLLNVDTQRCTALHCAEEQVTTQDHFFRPGTEAYECISRTGKTYTVVTRRHARYERAFNRFEPLFESQGMIGRDQLGGVPVMRVDLAPAIDGLREALERDVTALDPA
jgi:aminoglycoside 3-N-acetyltransferase